MCCLGVCAAAMGAPPENIEHRAMPYSDDSGFLMNLYESMAPGIGEDEMSSLAGINDDLDLTDRGKEARITKIFAKAGITVEFVP